MNRARLLRKKATDRSAFFGVICGTEILQATNFDARTVGLYILDFYCPTEKLAIELDGSGHDSRLREKQDKTRGEFLARQGIAVVRFWNHQVREELDSVLEAIWQALEERANLSP